MQTRCDDHSNVLTDLKKETLLRSTYVIIFQDLISALPASKRTECKTAWLTEALFTSGGGRAAAFWREADRSFDAKGLVEDFTQKSRAVGADYAVSSRLQRFRERSLYAYLLHIITIVYIKHIKK